MKLNISQQLIWKIVYRNLNLIICIIVVILATWLLYFIYQNVYLAAIAPEEIDKSEIIAKRQKVNLELFNAVNEKIIMKKSVQRKGLSNVVNPFVE